MTLCIAKSSGEQQHRNGHDMTKLNEPPQAQNYNLTVLHTHSSYILVFVTQQTEPLKYLDKMKLMAVLGSFL